MHRLNKSSWLHKGKIMFDYKWNYRRSETSSFEAWGWLAVCLICLCVVLYV